MDNTTRINQEMNHQTRINPSVSGRQTEINQDINEYNGTVINPDLTERNNIITNPDNNDFSAMGSIQAGSALLDRYTVKEKLNVSTGEADLYLCSVNNQEYVAKIYRRNTSIKQDVIEAIQKIQSPYVAKISDIGLFHGRTVEIIPYYAEGSLAGRKVSYEQIRNIVYCLNEALRALHEIKIIHKDLKPSNIMLWDDGNGVSIIDFGISSVTRDGQTVLVTKTGMTPEYSAPETLHSLFLEESDYYSLGITVYEMFCGHTPYSNLTTEEIAQYSLVQQFPFPQNMPEDLVALIKGLTYADITRRKEKSNPNRRWTYNEVTSWLRGEKLPIPGESETVSISMKPYSFRSKVYKDLPSLTIALAENWDFGKKELYRGSLSEFFKSFNPEIAGMCMDAEEAASKDRSAQDYYFFDILYKLNPGMKQFYWKDFSYISLPSMGRNILYKLRNQKLEEISLWNEILEQKVISRYISNHMQSYINLRDPIKWLEGQHTKSGRDSRDQMTDYYILGYLLSKEKELFYEDRFFTSISQLNHYLYVTSRSSMQRFEDKSKLLINFSNDSLHPQLEAWLFILNKGQKVSEWKNG